MKTRIIPQIGISFLDYPDNKSHTMMVYFLGCTHGCWECHNKPFQDEFYKGGEEFTVDELYKKLLEVGEKNFTNKIVFSGGEPLYKNNLPFVKLFLNKYSNVFDICIYTGYELPFVKSNNLKGFQFLKIGKYQVDKNQPTNKTDNFMQLSSSNQEFYNANYTQISRNGKIDFK